ncbi:MAG: UDP-N-acetylmuramoyl-L-alanine--D-glutamate ligase [Lishizhenia sp.]
MDTRNGHIAILGAGESGVGAALLAQHKGWNIFVSDFGAIKPKFKKELEENNIQFEEGKHTDSKILKATLIIKSPGIPPTAEIIQKAKHLGIKIISEIEFAAYYTKAKMICITGSNGKTTTTLLTHHVLKKAGLNVGLGGNVGQSLAKQVIENKHDIYVLELSSFQLDDMYEFKADIAVLLNITPDHLDRYEYSMENYADSKFRIIQNLNNTDWFIYNLDDPIIAEKVKKSNCKVQLAPFSLKQEVKQGGYTNQAEEIVINIKNQFNMSIHELALKGKHNTQNSLVAGISAKLLDIRKETIRESLADFTNVEHRLEFVAKVHGIEFINDSKATNINSTWFALESMDKPTVWIVGGVDKGNNYEELAELVTDKVKAIICLGKDNSKIIEAFTGKIETIVETQSIREAVAYGYRFAKKDETVLLSPCCASFDLFDSYEDRGVQFKEAVRGL